MPVTEKKRFSKDFTLQEPINDRGIEKALAILKSGKIHRYNVEQGEKGEAALLEEEFAAYMGKRYCLSCASCGSAMYLALKSAGVKPGEKVLCNAYTMGATWDGRKSDSFGKAGCFSTQTYKHMNSVEGGLLVTDDPDLIARAIIYSGSYMLYERHASRPGMDVFEDLKTRVPNYSCRMDNLRAAILRPQLEILDVQCERWIKRYRLLEAGLNKIQGITCPKRDPRENYVGSSIQFSLIVQDEATIRKFLSGCMDRGVELKWFGNKEPVGFTSAYSSWKYFGELPDLANTHRILATMCDMRIPLTFSLEDCHEILEIIKEVAQTLLK